MSFSEERSAFYRTVANGNELAREWLCLFHDYCHELDDVIDIPDWSPARVLAVFERANLIYTHPFYAAYRAQLTPAIQVATAIYSDANHWEKEPDLWKKQWADVMRHSGNEVIFSVAFITGGYAHLKSITRPMLAMCYIYHKDKYGVPQ